jgi:hypothetical protein
MAWLNFSVITIWSAIDSPESPLFLIIMLRMMVSGTIDADETSTGPSRPMGSLSAEQAIAPRAAYSCRSRRRRRTWT